MNIEEQMEISALLGIPLADFADKAEDFISKVHALVRRETNSPRDALILLALAYLYHVKIALKEDSNTIQAGVRALEAAIKLLTVAMENQNDPNR